MTRLETAIEALSDYFRSRNWAYLDNAPEKTYAWPAGDDEDIMICVHKGSSIHELFHRQDFFFLNFAYKGDYGAISYRYDNQITVCEGECYIGQPSTGYALYGQSEEEIIIVGILIRREAFYKSFLSVLCADSDMLRFFLEPDIKEFSDEFIRLKFEEDTAIRALLEIMIIEYADKKEDTQDILRPLVMSVLMLCARQNRLPDRQREKGSKLCEQIIAYINTHADDISLKSVATHFGYHPNYICNVLRKGVGRTFSEILLDVRMKRATALLRNTGLSIEEISDISGYGDTSNFYRAFLRYFGCSPREYVAGNIKI